MVTAHGPTTIQDHLKNGEILSLIERHDDCYFAHQEREAQMNIKSLGKKIGGAVLTLAFVFGLYAATTATTLAQYPYGRNNSAQDQRDRDREDRNRDRDRDRDRNRDRNRRGRNWDRYDNYGGNYQLRQTALNAGYNEGIKEGRKDRNRRERYDFSDFRSYRDATKDYNSRLGDRELYRRYFRQGFENGYADGYRGY
jgi:hypothetical protein